MKKNKFVNLLTICLLIIVSLSACSSESTENTSSENNEESTTNQVKEELKIGFSPSTKELAEASQDYLEDLGYSVEYIGFNDYVQPNIATVEGSLDATIYQHEPYMDVYNEENDQELKYVDRIAVSLFSLVSNQHETLGDLPDGATIGIFQDTTNQDRSLRMLADNDLLVLPEEGSEDGLYTLIDIEENPHNYEFMTLDINQLVTNIDEVDAAFVSDINLMLSDKDAEYTLIKEELNENAASYSVGLVTSSENETADFINDVLEAYGAESTRESLESSSGDAWVLIE